MCEQPITIPLPGCESEATDGPFTSRANYAKPSIHMYLSLNTQVARLLLRSTPT